jgi:hypothetical protein
MSTNILFFEFLLKVGGLNGLITFADNLGEVIPMEGIFSELMEKYLCGKNCPEHNLNELQVRE